MNILSSFKNTLSEMLIKLLRQPTPRQYLTDQIKHTAISLPAVKTVTCPYYPRKVAQLTCERDDIVFINSRFRSGSTLLWNIFRQLPDTTSYYEPFNERQWFNPDVRGQHTDGSHRGVRDYWLEYDGLAHLREYYNEDWIRHRLLMTESCWDSQMKAYIEKLIEAAPSRPVLQFNRIDFRLPWLRKQFPNAKFIHLYRNPRDQWCSFLTDPKLMHKDVVHKNYRDAFYLDVWCRDLQRHFPFLNKSITAHPYQRFYYLWHLSYQYGQTYCQHSLSFEDLASDTTQTLQALLAYLELDTSNVDKLSQLIDKPGTGRWPQYAEAKWFDQHEQTCVSELASCNGVIGEQI